MGHFGPESDLDPNTCQHDDLEPADHERCSCGALGANCRTINGSFYCGKCSRDWQDSSDRWNCRNCGGLIEHGKLVDRGGTDPRTCKHDDVDPADEEFCPCGASGASAEVRDGNHWVCGMCKFSWAGPWQCVACASILGSTVPVAPAASATKAPVLALSDADKVSLLRSLVTTVEQALATGVNPEKLPKLAEVREVLRLTANGGAEWPQKKALCGFVKAGGMCAKDHGHAGMHLFAPAPRQAQTFSVFRGSAIWRMYQGAHKDRVGAVTLIQGALLSLGFDPGTIDGLWGGRTVKAYWDMCAWRGHGSLPGRLTEEGLLVLQEAIEEQQDSKRAELQEKPVPAEDESALFEFGSPTPAQEA